MKPLVSIVIPVYNSEKFIGKCLESVINQSYKNIEVIVVNDGSNDKSIEIIKKYNDDRVKIINRKNSGVSISRNIGIEFSSGEYLVFIDSDDYVDRQHIENFLIKLKSFNNYIICGIKKIKNKKTQLCEIDNKFNLMNKNDKIKYLINNEILNSPINKIYSRKILIDNNIRFDNNISIGEDLLFNFRYIQYIDDIKFIFKYTYNYVIENQNSLSRKISLTKYTELANVIDIMKNIDKFGVDDALNNIKVKNICSSYKSLILYNDHLTVDMIFKYIKNINQVFDLKNIKCNKWSVNNLLINLLKILNEKFIAYSIFIVRRTI